MNKLPIEIENKIWDLYYSNIYYINVISVFNQRIALCNRINEEHSTSINYHTFDILSTEIGLLKYYNCELSKIYEKDEVKRKLFQISLRKSF